MKEIRGHNGMQILKGVGASPGVVFGQAHLVGRDKLKLVRRRIKDQEVEDELARFTQAVSQAEEQMSRLLAEMPEELLEHAGILKSHLLMLKDKMVYDRTLKLIAQEKINAEWALGMVMDHVRGLFEKIEDRYIRERVEDIEYVIQRVLNILAGKAKQGILDLHEPVVLVAHELSPADTVQLPSDKVLAFVTDMGSRTSHTAILARSLGIPAVVGLEDVTSVVFSGDDVIVDGITGQVIISPDNETRKFYEEKRECYLQYRLEVIHNSHLPAETKDGFRVKIKANMELLEEIPSVISSGAEGVGLLRTEYLYLASKELPTEETLFNAYKEVAERLHPYPVTIRTLDIGGDKFVSSVPFSEEINPALGLRAIRLSLQEPELFCTQLRAILMASAYGNIRILFPLVSGKREILKVKEHIHRVMEELSSRRIPFDEDLKLGIMMEVPTAIMVADILAREVDFFSLGTNDLIQYSLAIDRVNEYVAHLYEPLHPGVLRMIKRTIDAAHQAGIVASLCGEMAGEPMYVPLLVGMGIDELSMNAMDIPRVKRMVRMVSYDDCAALAKEILDASTAGEVRKLLIDHLFERFPKEFDPALGLHPELSGREVCKSTP